MAYKTTRQPRQNVKRPLVQPALPFLPRLNKAKSVTANTAPDANESPSIDLQENSSVSRKASDSGAITELEAKDNDADAIDGDASYAVPDEPSESTAEVARVVLNSDTKAEDIEDSNQVLQDIPAKESESQGYGGDLSTSSDKPPDQNEEPVAGIDLQSLLHHDLQEETVNNLSHSSSKELVSDLNALTTTTEIGAPADTINTEVNGQDTFTASDNDKVISQSISTQEDRSSAVSVVNEGYSSNGHSHTSISPQQPVQYNGHVQGRPTATPNDSPFVSLSDHLLQLSHTKAWSDYAIVVNTKGNQTFICYAHSMMLVRSPRLRKMMERQVASTQNNSLTIFTPSPMMPHAFEAALRFLYSDAVLTAEALFPRHVSPDAQPARIATLPYILSYWVSGVVLGIDHVTARASKLLSDFLDWDILEVLTKEAELLAAGIDAEALESDIDWSDLVTQWKTIALAYCATKIDPRTVKLDTSSSTLLRSRFGTLEDSRGKHNPALASMVFGSMPSSANMSPTSPRADMFQPPPSTSDTAISNILLNADYHDLVYFQHRLDLSWGSGGHQLLTDVVNEREHRRQKIISNQAIPNKQRTANPSVWDVVGFKEVTHDGEIRRERVSFLLSANR